MKNLRWSAFGSSLLLTLTVAAQEPEFQIPDPRTGVIDGLAGVLLWPAVRDATGEAHAVDPANCNAHVVPLHDPAAEFVFPCGKWFIPPYVPDAHVSKLIMWVEQGDQMSAGQGIFYYGQPSPPHGFRSFYPTIAAGQARLAPDADKTGASSIRLLSLNGRGAGFERRVPVSASGAPVRMPAGMVVAGLFDEDDNALALSRPFNVASGVMSSFTPIAPDAETGSVLLVSISRSRFDAGKVVPRLTVDGTAVEADTFAELRYRVVAIWYDLHGTSAELTVEGKTAEFLSGEIPINTSRIVTIRNRAK